MPDISAIGKDPEAYRDAVYQELAALGTSLSFAPLCIPDVFSVVQADDPHVTSDTKHNAKSAT